MHELQDSSSHFGQFKMKYGTHLSSYDSECNCCLRLECSEHCPNKCKRAHSDGIKIIAPEALFSRENSGRKNCAVCLRIIQTNNDKKHNNIKANEEQFTPRYISECRSCTSSKRCTRNVTANFSNQQMANGFCVLSKSTPNDLSQTLITAQRKSDTSVTSTPTMAYQDLALRTNDGDCSRDMLETCRLMSNRLTSPSLQTNKSWAVRFHKVATWTLIFKFLRTCILKKFHNSHSPMRNMNYSKTIRTFCYLVFLLLLITSMANAGFAGRRYSTRGGFGLRFPRQSGFRRNVQKTKLERCEPITVPTCSDIGYNQTDMSLSITNKFTQHEAQEELDVLSPILNWNCSEEVKLFLCSIYTPICMEHYKHFLPPCRFICERVKKGCLPIIQRYRIEWPENLRCEQFPTYVGKHPMCMHFNLTRTKEEEAHIFSSDKSSEDATVRTKSTPPPRTRTTTKRPHRPTRTPKTRQVTSTTKTTTRPRRTKTTTTPKTKKTIVHKKFPNAVTEVSNHHVSFQYPNSSLCSCNKPMVIINDPQDPLYNRVTTGGVPNCAVSCKSPYFTEQQILFSEMWIKCWSIVCFVVTLMTVSTFLIDMERFKYPERPIIFLSTCYMFVSIGFLIRIIAGHETVACAYRTDHVLYHTTGPVLCTTVFLLVYFFSMASALWWVILAMTWFLAAGLKWGSEAIEKYSQYYHAAAWLIPSLKSIMVLAMSSVDGDSLSGICFVGNQDVRALRGFVLAPLVVYLLLGGMFLLAGFISLFRIRSRIKKDGTKTDNLEKLMGRIGIFSVLYMVPAVALVACYFYEQKYRPMWEYTHNCKSIFKYTTDKSIEKLSFLATRSEYFMNGPITPEFIVFMVRYLMTLLIGITNGVWICSPKTLTSWKGFYRRCVCCLYGAPCPPPCGKDIPSAKPISNNNACSSNLYSKAKQVDRRSCTSPENDANVSDSRNDSFQTRNHDLSRIEYNQNDFQINSECRKSCSSRRTPSSRCEVCDRSSRSSSNNSRNPRRKRRRRSRSRTPIENCGRTEKFRVQPTGMEKDEAHAAMLCNNTTSTDGSDRHFLEESNFTEIQRDRHCCSCKPQHLTQHDMVYTRQGSHSSSCSKPSSAKACQVCHYSAPKSYQQLVQNGQSYVINDDNLPPCITRSHSSMTSQGFRSQKSTVSSKTSDVEEDDAHASFLNESSINENQHPASLPYFHYHHHHYKSKPES